MATFIMLTTLSPEAANSPDKLKALEKKADEKIRDQCPRVRWLKSYAVLGGCDYVDIFEAPDIETAIKVSALVRTQGHANTKVWPALEWDAFKSLMAEL